MPIPYNSYNRSSYYYVISLNLSRYFKYVARGLPNYNVIIFLYEQLKRLITAEQAIERLSSAKIVDAPQQTSVSRN